MKNLLENDGTYPELSQLELKLITENRAKKFSSTVDKELQTIKTSLNNTGEVVLSDNELKLIGRLVKSRRITADCRLINP